MTRTTDSYLLLALIIVVASSFDMCNGWHHGANSIQVVVYLGVMKPRTAAVTSALFNFIGPSIVGTAVAQALGSHA